VQDGHDGYRHIACGLFFWKETNMDVAKWRAHDLIVGSDQLDAKVSRLAMAVGRGGRARVEIDRTESEWLLRQVMCCERWKALFREGCVKAVEASIGTLSQKGHVLAEIHRRLDRLSSSASMSEGCRYLLASVYDFAGAWTLAARLMRRGVHVSVVEEGASAEGPGHDPMIAEVEIVIPVASER
jgi:hypothetical protein